jgi:hypothetical protein
MNLTQTLMTNGFVQLPLACRDEQTESETYRKGEYIVVIIESDSDPCFLWRVKNLLSSR